ncbi:hypothetical protein [Massiliimalia massiliensis]|uniref:hypothetical protein n=1 Tax=Massiliimalia massiliensis TaxID=1852384 RepID=UPI00098432A1|nr:hypothetical protein [Massiliimalia massiliensis]
MPFKDTKFKKQYNRIQRAMIQRFKGAVYRCSFLYLENKIHPLATNTRSQLCQDGYHPSIGRRRKRGVLEQEAAAGKTTEAGCNSSNKPIVADVAANIGGFKNESFKKRNI